MKKLLLCVGALAVQAVLAKDYDTKHINVFEADTNDYRKIVAEYDKIMADHQALSPELQALGKPSMWTPDKPGVIYPEAIARAGGERMANRAKVQAGDLPCPKPRMISYGRPSMRLPITFSQVGKYRLWLKYYQTSNLFARVQVRVQDATTETIRFTEIDPAVGQNVDSYKEGRFFAHEGERPSGFVWAAIDLEMEYPSECLVWVKRNDFDNWRGNDAKRLGSPLFGIADCWISNDPDFDPEKNPAASEVAFGYEAPKGWQKATVHEPNIALNTAVLDTQKRNPFMLLQCYQHYTDDVRTINLGCTDGIGGETRSVAETKNSPAVKYNGVFQVSPEDRFGGAIVELRKKYPFDPGKDSSPSNNPVGRSGYYNWEQKKWVYSNNFADCFPEYVEAYGKNADAAAKKAMANPYLEPNIAFWWTAWEQCGTYEYGETGQREFRKYLKDEVYGSIEKLNEAWHTDYKSFDEIVPECWDACCGPSAPKDELKRCQNTANFIDFRAFSSKAYARLIAKKTEAALKNDPKKRHVSSNLSCNNLSSVMWMRWRPLIFEDTVRITQKGSDMVGYDNYGTDDNCGCYFELFDSFGDGKVRPMVREGATHAPNPHLMSRQMWGNFAKGMRGMSLFCAAEFGQGELTKFGLTDPWDDGAPSAKLAAASDNFRAVNQMGHLLSETVRDRSAVKKVAIYYSPICNVLLEKPYASIFDCGPDQFFRVYELIHASGYDCCFVTDTHFREHPEWIDTLQAVFFVDATYIPTDVQEKVMDWVEKGGHVVVDAQGGSRDGHGFMCKGFTEWLGVQPVQQQKIDENKVAAALSFGYSAYSFDVINRDELYKTAAEFKDCQGPKTHPLAKAVGKMMFSAMGYQEVKLIEGEQIISENNGRPAWVIRNHGKGTSSYFAGYLGTAYGAGCTTYEWSDKHSGSDPYRFIDAYLAYIGAKKTYETDLRKDAKYYLRNEAPLVDKRGNAAIAVVSQNPYQLPSFRIKSPMPKSVKEPKMVLAARNGSRKLESCDYAFDKQTRELSVRVPGVDDWTQLMALNDCQPMVSVEIAGEVRRGEYDLVDLRPGEELTFKVKVFNPSGSKLAKGEIELRLPQGWFCEQEKVAVGKVAKYGVSDEFVFRVKAPSVCTSRRLKPINFVYRNEDVESCPAVEMVWFQRSSRLPAPVAFGVK